jgi:hypothetical protein
MGAAIHELEYARESKRSVIPCTIQTTENVVMISRLAKTLLCTIDEINATALGGVQRPFGESPLIEELMRDYTCCCMHLDVSMNNPSRKVWHTNHRAQSPNICCDNI